MIQFNNDHVIVKKSSLTLSLKLDSISIKMQNDLIHIYRAAIRAVKPDQLIHNSIKILENGLLTINMQQQQQQLKPIQLNGRDVYIFGAGK